MDHIIPQDFRDGYARGLEDGRRIATTTVTDKDVRRFAAIMHEELNRNGWGDIDPTWFNSVANDDHDDDDAVELGNILKNALRRYVGGDLS